MIIKEKIKGDRVKKRIFGSRELMMAKDMILLHIFNVG